MLPLFVSAFWAFHPIAEATASEPDTLAVITLDYEPFNGPVAGLSPAKTLKRPKLGLALSGGGLRGVAQLGVIKTLVDNHIPIDYIVGSSIGALVGGLVASGYSADDLWQIAQSIDWGNVLDDTPQRSTLLLGEKAERNRALLQFRLNGMKPSLPEAYTPGFKLTDILTNLVINAPYHSQDFTRLPIALKIIATDLHSGKRVLLTDGDLTEAIRASIAIPLLLTPVRLDSMYLVDGGLLNNIPVDETRAFGADKVIAVNTTSPLRSPQDMKMPWEVLDQVTTIMQIEQKRRQLQKADLQIDFSDVPGTSTNIENLELFYLQGQKRAEKLLPLIKEWLDDRMPKSNQKYRVDKIETTGLYREDENPIAKLRRYSEIDKRLLQGVLKSLYQTDRYDSLFAVIEKERLGTVLQIKAKSYPVPRQITFDGNVSLSDSILVGVIEPVLNQPFGFRNSRFLNQQILKVYRSHGFSLARINKISCDNQGGLTVEIDEGQIGDLNIVGNDITKDFVIRREFHVTPNSTFELSQMQNGISNLYASGLFNSIIFKVNPNGTKWDCNLSLVERLPRVVRLGINYERERNGRSFIEFSDENLGGTGNDLTVHGMYGDRDAKGAVIYRADRIFKTLLSSTLDVHYTRSKYFAYENFTGVGEYERRSYGGVFSVGRHIERFGMLSVFLRMERIYLRSISGYGYDAGRLHTNTFGFTTTVDTRDRLPFPKSGKYYNFFYEVSAGDFLSADISYFRVQNSLTTFLTFFKRNTISPKLIWATSDLTTPYSEQFRFGGQDSFYGLREGELQGRHAILASLEYRYWLPVDFLFDTYLSFQFDVGAAWKNVLEAQFDDFVTGRGVALSFDTPIGPLSFGYGRSSSGRSEAYFKAGYDF